VIKFGLIGCGRISDRHIASLAKCEGAALAAICDVQQARMDLIEASYRNLTKSDTAIARYSDAESLLKDANVDAVVIATPSAAHASLALQAIRSGKHVILEKPMALSLEDARKIADLSKERRIVVQVCHQLRYRTLLKRVKEAITSGSMGAIRLGVVSMRLNRSEAYYEAAPWRGTWEFDGGMLLNQGIHLVDLLQWYMGEAYNVLGRISHGPIRKQTEDVAAGIIAFENGAIGVIEANTLTYPSNYDNSITLFGDRGTVSIGGIALNEIRKWSIPGVEPPNPQEEIDEHLEMYVQFMNAVQTGSDTSLIHAEEGKRAVELIFSLYESARTRQSVTAPLSAFATTMMLGSEEAD